MNFEDKARVKLPKDITAMLTESKETNRANRFRLR